MTSATTGFAITWKTDAAAATHRLLKLRRDFDVSVDERNAAAGRSMDGRDRNSVDGVKREFFPAQDVRSNIFATCRVNMQSAVFVMKKNNNLSSWKAADKSEIESTQNVFERVVLTDDSAFAVFRRRPNDVANKNNNYYVPSFVRG